MICNNFFFIKLSNFRIEPIFYDLGTLFYEELALLLVYAMLNIFKQLQEGSNEHEVVEKCSCISNIS